MAELGHHGRILLVEDDEDIRRLLQSLLTEEGFVVEEASGGIEALELLKTSTLPDVILLDLSMPKMSGEEFVSILNTRPDRPRTKVIVTSGWEDLPIRAERIGADDFVRKPIDFMKIVSTVERVLN